MSKIFKFLKKIFSKKKDKLEGADLISDLIRRSISGNILDSTEEDIEASVEQFRFRRFEDILYEISNGYILTIYSDTEEPLCTYFFPEPAIKSLSGPTINDDSENRSLIAFLEKLDGNFSGIFNLGKREEDKGHPIIRIKNIYTKSDQDSILWHASETEIFRITAGDAHFYILIHEKEYRLLLDRITDEDFLKSIENTLFEEIPASEPEDKVLVHHNILNIEKPKEFLLGGYFLPEFVKDKDLAISSTFRSIYIPQSFDQNGFWVTLTLEINGSSCKVRYFFKDLSPQEFTSNMGSFDLVFKTFLRSTIAYCKSTCSGIEITSIRFQGEDPLHDESTDSLMLEANVAINDQDVTVLVLVPRRYLEIFYSYFLESREVTEFKKGNLLAPALLLNRKIFGKNISQFINRYKGDLADMPVTLASLPFFQFMDLIDDQDLKIIVQNFLVPRLSHNYMNLFNISLKVERGDENNKRNIFQVNFDKKRFDRFLPPALVNDEKADEQNIHMAHFDDFNREFMEALYSAVEKDKILVSYKTEFILRNQFHDTIESEDQTVLNELKEKGIPFKEMSKLNRKSHLRIMGKLSNQDICHALINDDSEIDYIKNLMSETRKKELSDDLIYYWKLYRERKIPSENIIKSIKEIHRVVVDESYLKDGEY